jgi:hypothetical protein
LLVGARVTDITFGMLDLDVAGKVLDAGAKSWFGHDDNGFVFFVL